MDMNSMNLSNPEQHQQQLHENENDGEEEESAAMVMNMCPHCHKLVPEQNRILHTVNCQRQQRQQQHQSSSFSTTQEQQNHQFSSEEEDVITEEQRMTNTVEQQPCPKDRNNNNNGMDGILYAAAGSTTPNPSLTSEDATTTTTSVPPNNKSNEIIDDGGSKTQPIDLSSTPQAEEEEEEETMEEEWSCPQCTLLNPISSSHCDACRFANSSSSGLEDAATATGHDLFDIRTPDATRRTRLIGNPNDDEEDAALIDLIHGGMRRRRRRSTFANPTSFTDHHHHRDTPPTRDEEGIPLPNNSSNSRNLIPGGAILGSLIGGSSAYLRGRSVGSGVLEGAMMGTVGGAVLNDFFGGSNNTPSFTGPMGDVYDREHTSSFASPRRIRVVRFDSSNNTNNDDVMNRFDEDSSTNTNINDGSRNNTDEFLRQMLLPLVHNNHHHHHPRTNGMDIDNMNYEQLLELFGDGSSQNRGASPSTIRSLPVTTLSDPMTELPEENRNCSVCLESFEKGDQRMMLPCLHGFHKGCIDRWLEQNGSCPVCKHVLSD